MKAQYFAVPRGVPGSNEFLEAQFAADEHADPGVLSRTCAWLRPELLSKYLAGGEYRASLGAGTCLHICSAIAELSLCNSAADSSCRTAFEACQFGVKRAIPVLEVQLEIANITSEDLRWYDSRGCRKNVDGTRIHVGLPVAMERQGAASLKL